MFNLWFFKKLDSSRDKYTNKNTQLCSHTHTQISWPFWLKMSWRVLKWGHAVYEEQNWLRCERRTGSSHYGGLQPNNKPEQINKPAAWSVARALRAGRQCAWVGMSEDLSGVTVKEPVRQKPHPGTPSIQTLPVLVAECSFHPESQGSPEKKLIS